MLTDLFLPTLPHWTYGNDWSGSWEKVRFFITTSADSLQLDVWDSDICHELAQVKATKTFPITEDGLIAMRAWLEDKIMEMNNSIT